MTGREPIKDEQIEGMRAEITRLNAVVADRDAKIHRLQKRVQILTRQRNEVREQLFDQVLERAQSRYRQLRAGGVR